MFNLYRFVRVIFCSNFPDCQVTTCLSSHMTLFGGGFFVQPHSLDFKFIFAESDFSVGVIDIVSPLCRNILQSYLQNNILIYVTIILSIIGYLLFLIWGKIKDIR